jgi:type I restriction enzyme S subunit
VKEGWQTKTLGDICDIARGGSPRPIEKFLTDNPDGINWIKIGDATASLKYIYKTEEKIKPEGMKRSRLVKDGDFLLSNSMSFGRPYIMRTTGCIHDGWLVLSDKSGLFDQDYLYYFLGSSAAYQQFDNLAAGSTVRNLNTEVVKRVTLPLPPLPEQRRIVAVLDEIFAGLSIVTTNAEKNLKSTRELVDSYLNSVFRKKGPGWVEKQLRDVVAGVYTGPFGSVLHKSDYVVGGTPIVIRLTSSKGRFFPTQTKL